MLLARLPRAMASRTLSALLLLPVLALAACGSKTKEVNTTAYTCAEFNKSLATKSDNTSGNYINGLRKQANLGQDAKTERREITLGIFFACRGKPGTTKPATTAIASAKAIKSGKFHIPGPAKGSKKSSK
jgi:hypothetical protein